MPDHLSETSARRGRRSSRPDRGAVSGLELVWPGKYGPDGRRVEQSRTIEPLIEVERFAGADGTAPNLLVGGDNLRVLPALLALSPRAAAIYADPPFLTGDRFRMRSRRAAGAADAGKDPDAAPDGSRGEGDVAYDDLRLDGLGGFAAMLAPRLVLLRDLLAPGGALYLHLDARTAHVARLVCDEVLGPGAFRNHLVWVYGGRELARRRYNAKHDDILYYVKGRTATFHPERILEPLLETSRRAMSRHVDDEGRAYVIRYRRGGGFAGRDQPGLTYRQPVPDGTLPRDWFAIDYARKAERTGYPTQKPGALVERLLLASTEPGDLVVDPFVGSGTAAVVAATLGRRWIAIDASALAIATSRRRLLGLRAAAAGFRVAAVAGSLPPVGNLDIVAKAVEGPEGRYVVTLGGRGAARVDAWAVGTVEGSGAEAGADAVPAQHRVPGGGLEGVFAALAARARDPWHGRLETTVALELTCMPSGLVARAWDDSGAATMVSVLPSPA